MTSDLLSVGEILIDLTQTGHTAEGIPLYAACPGGAPANAAVAAARLGTSTAFLGCVGRDSFGAQLRRTLEENGVDTALLQETDQAPTTLAVVSLTPDGERSHSFYRTPGADTCFTWRADLQRAIDRTPMLHVGSVSMTTDPGAATQISALQYAQKLGRLICCDPNYRPSLWPDRETARARIRTLLPYAQVVKLSEEETELVTGREDPEEAALALEELGIPLGMVTLGPRGVLCRYGGRTETVPGYAVSAVDTNGAGDAFCGAVLSALAKRGGTLEGLTWRELSGILRFANCAAALTVTRSGAIPALPTSAQVCAAQKILQPCGTQGSVPGDIPIK